MDFKYTVEIGEGCTSFYTTINDKLVSGEGEITSDEEIDEFVDYLCAKFKEELRSHTVSLDDLIKCFQSDDYEYDDTPCDQCGDNFSKTTWRL